MLQRWIVLGLLALIILPGLLVSESRAEAVSVSLSGGLATVKMNLVLQENLTALPLIKAQIGPFNSTAVVSMFSEPFNNAIGKSVPGASLSSLEISIETSNSTSGWTLKENYTMVISGADTNSGSSVAFNLAFVSMNVTGPINVNGVELNFVGPDTLLPALQAKAAEFSNLKFYIDGSNPRTSLIPELTTQHFLLLDFTWSLPVSEWTSTQNILGKYTTWAYDPLNPQYNLTLAVPSPEGLVTREWTTIYNPSLSVTVPAAAWATRNTVYFDTPTSSETIMPVIVAVALVSAIATFILDRRLSGPYRVRRKR